MGIQFEAFPKIARLNRHISITEKIDGTNAAIGVVPVEQADLSDKVIIPGNSDYAVYAQSRTRIITPTDDNYGFARWVYDNADILSPILGPGLHHGEWWGSGINRGYGLTKGDKRFSLFNTLRYADDEFGILKHQYQPLTKIGVDVVPTLYRGMFFEKEIHRALDHLRHGSIAAPGYDNPEGIIVFHLAARIPFKITLVGDEAPKSTQTQTGSES